MRAGPPESELLRASDASETVEQPRVPSTPPLVEVRGGAPSRTNCTLTFRPSFGADDVAKQPPVLIHAVGRWFREQAHASAGRQQALRHGRCLPGVALGAEVHLGSVDLDEPDSLAVSEGNRVAVSLLPPNGRDPTPLSAAARLYPRDLLRGLIHEYEAA
jgi:hypothetical protein